MNYYKKTINKIYRDRQTVFMTVLNVSKVYLNISKVYLNLNDEFMINVSKIHIKVYLNVSKVYNSI